MLENVLGSRMVRKLMVTFIAEDNLSRIFSGKNPIVSDASKHFDLKFHIVIYGRAQRGLSQVALNTVRNTQDKYIHREMSHK